MWERTGECAMAATLARHFNYMNVIESIEQQDDVTVASSEDKKMCVLYDKDDDKHINALHNIVRRDIWEDLSSTPGARI